MSNDPKQLHKKPSEAIQEPVPPVILEEPVVEDTGAEKPVEEPVEASADQDTPKYRAILEYSYSSPKKGEGTGVNLPSHHTKETQAVINDTPNISFDDHEASRKWATTVTEGLEFITEANVYVPTLEDSSAEFKQAVEFNGHKLGATQPRFKDNENQHLTGERGVIRIMSALGLGTLFNTPLWHSGIWITFKAPTESEIIELNRMLVSDKIRFGRSTYSLAFSNLTSYTTDKLVRFALEHVYDTTIKADELRQQELRALIACQDIPTLLWGFVCTMYPQGFQYQRACINDPVKCNYILEETLNVSKLQWTNHLALTDWQKTHMSVRRPNSKSLNDIKRYKEELTKIQSKKVSINTDSGKVLELTLKSPNINEHVDAGQRWVGEIVSLVDKTLGTEAGESERHNFIIRHGQASAMRQYVHWVESLEIDTNIVDDRETIEEVINVLSSSDQVRTDFIQAIIDYINQSTISLIGIPAFDCPKCKHPQDLEHPLPHHANIIPLDVHQLFFALATAQISRIITR